MEFSLSNQPTTTPLAIPLLEKRYRQIRQISEEICKPLALDDYGIQSMTDVSPPKWHLAHTTWFFETFILRDFFPKYRPFHPQYHFLFNSYYETLGAHHPRPKRGLLNRPTVMEIYRYRAYVDQHLLELICKNSSSKNQKEISLRVELGLQHEQQHQELLLMDIKHIYASNPLKPSYSCQNPPIKDSTAPLKWKEYPGGIIAMGHSENGFAFDNEKPKHEVFLQGYALSNRLVTNGEYLEFINAGGYQKTQYWLADGWIWIQDQKINAPLYWEKLEGHWCLMKLSGFDELNEHEPVCHVSFFEAEAFAKWKGNRLATEAQWENAALELDIEGNFYDQGYLHPIAPFSFSEDVQQIYGDLWEFTRSAYSPYPGFKPEPGSIGEYNGKFMCNQMVLRGGSCVTSRSHLRASYRNYFYPAMRWQFSGIRLAKDLS